MTGNEVIEEVVRLLLSGQREELNKLDGAVAPGATEIELKYDAGPIRNGAQIDIDLETYRVWNVDGKRVTVEPGMAGTTTAAHADGALVNVNPRMSRAAVFKALNDEIRSLSAQELYQVKEVEFRHSSVREEYDLAGDGLNLIDVIDVKQKMLGPGGRWAPLPEWRYASNSDAESFESGRSLFIPTAVAGQPVRVLVKAEFTPLTAPTDDIAVVSGMPAEMHDILSLGVLLRLGPVREIKRNFTEAQGDSRKAEEVGAGAVQQSFSYVRQLRQERIAAEQWRLASKYPKRHPR